MLGLFSLNVRVPHHGEQAAIEYEPIPGEDSPYWYFLMVIGFMFLFAACVATTVRYLRWKARTDLDKKRGRDSAEFWDAYWGWK